MKHSSLKIGLFSSLVLTLFYCYSLLPNISKPFSLKYGDSHQVNFILKHNLQHFLYGSLSGLPNLSQFYGFQNTLFFSNHFLLQSLMAIPIYIFTKNPTLTFNLLAILTLMFSFFSMYSLVHFLTKKILPGILSGIIFTFNPFISVHFPDSLELFSLQYLPLIFLFLEKYFKDKKGADIFFFFLFLSCQLLSGFYYAAFLSIILPLYLAIRLYQEKISPKEINSKLIIGVLIFISIIALTMKFYLPFLLKENRSRPLLETSMFYSPYFSNWFFTPPENILYGNLGKSIEEKYPAFFSFGRNSEMSFFWGFLPLLLFFLSFKFLKKSPLKKIWLTSIILLLVNWLLSLGPYMHISQNFSLPGPFLLVYKLNPLFAFIRVPGRFAVFVFFFLGVIAGLLLSEIEKKISSKKALFLGISLIIILMLEYSNRPFEFLAIPPETKAFFVYLKKQEDIKVVVDLPIGNRLPENLAQARLETLDSHYLLWALFHEKTLLNGYSSFLPNEYVKRATLLSLNNPINIKVALLKKWGVDAIILHKDEFKNKEDFSKIKNDLLSLNIPQIASTPTLSLFDLTKPLTNY